MEKNSNKKVVVVSLTMLLLLAASVILFVANDTEAAQRSGGQELPWSLRGVRDSLREAVEPTWGLMFIPILFLAGVAVLLLFNAFSQRSNGASKASNDPDKLFGELLDELKLAREDKLLLRRLVSGARLRHPAMALLSPGMLAWAQDVWLREKGTKVVTTERLDQLNNISRRLFGRSIRVSA